MKLSAFIIIAVLALSTGASTAATTSNGKFGPDRHWVTSQTDDEFNGKNTHVNGVAFRGERPLGLMTIGKREGRLFFMLTDNSQFFCQSDGSEGLEVAIWFSANKEIITMDWEISDSRQAIFPPRMDGEPFIHKMLASDQTIFRVSDGCGDILDYKVHRSNVSEEFDNAGF